MNRHNWFVLVLTYLFSSTLQAAPLTANILPSPTVIYLSVGKADFIKASGSYILPGTIGTTIVLLVHTKTKVFKFDPFQSQLEILSDNLGTDLLSTSRQRATMLRSSYPGDFDVTRFGEHGINLAFNSPSADGINFLLTINSIATPALGATQLHIRAKVVLLMLGENTGEHMTEVNDVSITNDTNKEGASIMVNGKPFILSIARREPYGDDQIIHYKITTPLAITRVEAYDMDGANKIGEVVILPGKENTLPLKRIHHVVKLKIYFQTANVVTVPIDVTTGIGI